MTLLPGDIISLLIAFLLGGMIGVERELREKAAGFRTLMFISAGSALFTIFSLKIAAASGATGGDRIAAQIVTGVGFLGAGVILREGGEIRGLTTASTIWLAAALGMGAGGGYYLLSFLAAAVIMIALVLFPRFERFLNARHQIRTYHVTLPYDMEKYQALGNQLSAFHLHVFDHRPSRRGDHLVAYWTASGPYRNHENAYRALLEDPSLLSVDYQLGGAKPPA